MKLEISEQISEKYLTVEFHENLSSGGPVASRGQTEGQTGRNETKSRFSQFRERA
jgi:hypothetical protein